MKLIIKACLVITLIVLITSNLVWARGGAGYGGGHYGGGRGGHYGGSHHYSGGWGYGHRGNYGGSSFGFYFGAPFYSYPYFPYRYPYYYQPYYPPAIVTVPATPQIYIQQTPPASQSNPSGYWYYCNNPEGYYPYVKECPHGWQQVEPIPPAPSVPR